MLVVAAAFNASVYKRDDRVMVCILLMLFSSLHFIVFDGVTGLEYYGSAAVGHLIINWMLDRVDDTYFSSDIALINYVALLGQCFGFVCYVADVSQIPYNALMTVLAVVEMARLVIRTGRDKEDDERRDYYRRHGVFGNHLGSNTTGSKGG